MTTIRAHNRERVCAAPYPGDGGVYDVPWTPRSARVQKERRINRKRDKSRHIADEISSVEETQD